MSFIFSNKKDIKLQKKNQINILKEAFRRCITYCKDTNGSRGQLIKHTQYAERVLNEIAVTFNETFVG